MALHTKSFFFSRYTFTVLSNILVYCVTWGVLHITNENPDEQIGPKDADKFQKIVFIGMFVGLVFTIIFHLFVKESRETYGTFKNFIQSFDSFDRK